MRDGRREARVGRGLDSDGTLDTGEVDGSLTRYVCTSARGRRVRRAFRAYRGRRVTMAFRARLALPAPLEPRESSASARREHDLPEAAGSNCATGGLKFETGLDLDRDGALALGEVDFTLTRYVCPACRASREVQGPTGTREPPSAGLDGCSGSVRPSGPARTSKGLYRDRLAGSRRAPLRHHWISAAASGVAILGGANQQFTDINISGTLVVPIGTVLRATGDVSITGTVYVTPGASESGYGEALREWRSRPLQPRSGRRSAGSDAGGAGHAWDPEVAAWRTGRYRSVGGAGGGSILITGGNLRVPPGGIISASGEAGAPAALSSNAVERAAARVASSSSWGALRRDLRSRSRRRRERGGGASGSGDGRGGGGDWRRRNIHCSPAPRPSRPALRCRPPGAQEAPTPNRGVFTHPGSGGGACGGNGGNGGGHHVFGGPIQQAGAGESGRTLTSTSASRSALLPERRVLAKPPLSSHGAAPRPRRCCGSQDLTAARAVAEMHMCVMKPARISSKQSPLERAWYSVVSASGSRFSVTVTEMLATTARPSAVPIC